MADSLVRSSDLRVPVSTAAVEPLTVDVLGDRVGASEPTYEVKQGGTRLSSQNLAALTTGLKIMTSLRGHFVTKVKSVDGLSASLRRSDDDDGYCSRSSLDSPVQITRPDAVSPTAVDDSVEMFAADVAKTGRRSCCASPSPSVGPTQREDDGANDELTVDGNSQTAAAVASLDHCYLTATGPSSPDDQLPSPVDAPLDCDGGPLSVDETAGQSLSAAGRRNISIFVVPQPMPSTGLRWRARIIRADATSCDETSGVAAAAQNAAASSGEADKPEVAASRSSSAVQASASKSWLPLSAVNSGRVKSTTTGRRQRPTVGSRLAALTATADSLSRQIARVATTSARTGRHTTSERRRSADYYLRDLSVRLHPLVDHDYGAFATFNAEVQSSIISTTTDGFSHLDWRSIRRHRTAPAPPPPSAARVKSGVAFSAMERPRSPIDDDSRPKRKYCRRQPQDGVYGYNSSYVGARPSAVVRPNQRSTGRKGRPPLLDARRQSVGRKRPLQHDRPPSPSLDRDDGKNYVKIPGHYQDDFVYYATKRARGRPRKNLQDCTVSTATSSSGPTPCRPTAVGGINVFDWYREMAQTDKSTRFGVPTTTATTGDGERPPVSSPGWADTTPVDESAVADLVMDMMPSSSAAGGVTTDYTGGGDRHELTETEEDFCAMLRSLNEADLKLLESHLDHEEAAKNGAFDGVDKVETETGS